MTRPHNVQPDQGHATMWYAAFGSNLSSQRLLAYLTGTTPTAGTRRERGATDASPPRADDAATFPYELFFAYESTRWGGGGVAFIRPAPAPGHETTFRLWKITRSQFADLQAQECRSEVPPELPSPTALAQTGSTHDTLDRLYGRLISLGTHGDGDPIATITTARTFTDLNPPHRDYLATIATGLREMGWSTSQITDYLSAKRGVAGELTEQALTDAIAGLTG